MRRVHLLLLGILILLASACRVETTVEIAVDDNGSGTVTVTVEADAEAVALLPDAPDGFQFDDLADAGWAIEGPEVDVAGAFSVSASKPFANADALPGVLAEIAGEDVLFVDVALDKSHSFDWIGLGPASTDFRLTGTLDPAPDLEAFADSFLPASVDFSDRTGLDTDQLNLTVRVRLPGSESTETGEVDGESVIWEVDYGDAAVDFDARSSIEDILPRVWAMVALLAGLLLLGLFLARLAGYGLAMWRTPKGRRRRDVRRRQHRAATRAEEANRPRRRMLRLLIVDVHGVVVRPTDPLEGLLLPLITGEHPDVDPGQVRDLYRKLVLGRVSVEEFWADVGLGPVAQEIETKYLSSFRLVPGLHPFLDRMKTSRLPVAAVGNQPRSWGDRLRRMAALDDAVSSWLVSGDVGSTLPEPALFEATRRTMSVDLFDCFYLSNVPENLDAAKDHGMATGLFVAGDEPAPETEHTVVRGFEDLLRSRGG
jgi:FMN phosphatase YigB (HAD superfamily)